MAAAAADFFRVDRRRLGSTATTLSGGNQQKVALGKWLAIEPRVLLVDEPTRGVDVGARAEIYGHLRRLANGGQAIIFASSDIAEVMGLADTVVTFYRGREVARYSADDADERSLVRDITHPDVASADVA
jgi:ABC-type sugar transport system ATPase subunit